MIIYDLECRLGHRFEGWFPSLSAFETQKKQGLLNCSICGVHEVHRLPSGGHNVGLNPLESPKKPTPTLKKLDSQKEHLHSFDPVTFIKAVHQYVMANAKDVGSDFAKKATQIHRGEILSEPIYGTANEEEKEQLDAEEIPYTLIPKLTPDFEN